MIDPTNEVPDFVVQNANVLDIESDIEIKNTTLKFSEGFLCSISDEIIDHSEEMLSINVDEGWVLPALVDLHSHPAPIADPSVNRLSEDNPTERYGPIGTAQLHSNLKEALQAGIMGIRDMGTPEEAMDELSPYREGDLPPLIDSCVRPITGTDGHLSTIGYEVSSITDIRDAVAEVKSKGAAHIKAVKDFSIQEDLFRSLVTIAHDQGLPVLCHVHSEEETEMAIRAECDSIEHVFPPNEELAELAKKNNTTFVPTFYCSETTQWPQYLTDIDSSDMSIFSQWNKQIKKDAHVAIESDVEIGIGTDAGMPPVGFGDVWKEIQCLYDLGFSKERLIKSATTGGAEKIGMGSEWSIEEGTTAFLIVVDGDPREDIRFLKSAEPLVFDGIPLFSTMDHLLHDGKI